MSDGNFAKFNAVWTGTLLFDKASPSESKILDLSGLFSWEKVWEIDFEPQSML